MTTTIFPPPASPLPLIARRAPGFPPAALAPLVLAPPAPGCRICVVIPARDEAEHVGACLAAFAEQRGPDGEPFDRAAFEIILLANNCRDATAPLARRVAARFPGLRVHVVEAWLGKKDAHVGNARRLLMEEAHRRLVRVLGRPRGIIATTDADTVVAPDWLAATEREIGRGGAEAVGGNIRPCPRGLAALTPGARRLERLDTVYRRLANRLEHELDPTPGDPWPRHHHHFGGSLAVTAASYRRAGGLPPLPALEDVAFYEALRRHDIPFRHSLAVRVLTSARCFGRTPHGLAVTLRRWTEAGDGESPGSRAAHPVEPAAALEIRVLLRRELRELWRARAEGANAARGARLARVAGGFGVPGGRLAEELARASAFGALHERLLAAGSPAHALPPPVDVELAIAGLRARLGELRANAERLEGEAFIAA